jgi:N-acyl amino acid synthase of PEP-CTERM/exosortase system
VSRFCVSPDFKRRRGETGTQAGLDHRDLSIDSPPGAVDRRMFPHIMVALITCVVRMTVRNGITHLYCFMETPLIRLCGQLGIQFTPVGPLSMYHGQRQPSTIQVPEDLEPVREKNRRLWNLLTDHGHFWQDEIDNETRYHVLNPAVSTMSRGYGSASDAFIGSSHLFNA